jgi:hypothetical protein
LLPDDSWYGFDVRQQRPASFLSIEELLEAIRKVVGAERTSLLHRPACSTPRIRSSGQSHRIPGAVRSAQLRRIRPAQGKQKMAGTRSTSGVAPSN